jgi:hypothetical protein
VSLCRRGLVSKPDSHLKHGSEIVGEHPSILAALAYADRTLAQDPSNPHAHLSKGVLSPLQGNLPMAIWHVRQALAAEPGNATSIGWLCWLYRLVGQGRLADPLPDRMLRLDPVNPMSHVIHCLNWFMQGRVERAADLTGVFLKMAPGVSFFVFWYALILAYAGRGQESQGVLASLPEEADDDGLARLGQMLRCALSEEDDGFRRTMTPHFEAFARRDLQWSWHVAAFCAKLGERELALNWLTNAVNRGFANAQFIDPIDPCLEGLRGDRRFRGLTERAREKQRAFEV